MKDIVSNRERLAFGEKLRVLRVLLRENGPLWTFYFGIYYLFSFIDEAAYRRMDALRREKKLPGLTSRALNEEIWDHWDWQGGGEEWTLSEEWKESLLKNILEKNVGEGLDVLEIGPGGGRWTGHLLERAKSFAAVDISESCLKVCREKFRSFPDARFIKTDGSSLRGIDDESVDVIWSFDVFVHINEAPVREYADEFERVLRPGGRAIIQHGTVGGRSGGWRSDLDTGKLNAILQETSLELVEQFTEWEDHGTSYRVGLYEDAVSILEKPRKPGVVTSDAFSVRKVTKTVSALPAG